MHACMHIHECIYIYIYIFIYIHTYILMYTVCIYVSTLYASTCEYIVSIMFTDFILTRISCLRNKVSQSTIIACK